MMRRRSASGRRVGGAVAALLLVGGATGAGCFFTPGEKYPAGPTAGPAGTDPPDEPPQACTPGAAEGCDTARPGEVVWAIAAGGSGTQEAFDIAVDGEGNVLVGGRFNGRLTLGGTSYVSDGDDGFLLKLSADGKLLWVRQLGGAGEQTVRGVAVDDLGNAYITGSFSQEMIIGMTRLETEGEGDVDFLVARLDASGEPVWASDYGTGPSDDADDDQVALGIAVTGEDNVTITGWFRGHVSVPIVDDMTIDETSAGGRDLFVAGIGKGGTMRWFSRFGDDSEQVGRNVALGDDVYVIGDARGSFDVENTQLALGNTPDLLAVALDGESGIASWAINFDTSPRADHTRGHDITLARNGDLLLAGFYNGTLDLGGGGLASTGQSRFVTRRDKNGQHIWSRGFAAYTSAVSGEERIGITADKTGSVFLAGEFSGTADFGGDLLVSDGAGDIYIAKLDPDGAHLWSRRFGDARDQFAYAVAADPTGHAVITGNFRGDLDLDGTILRANGDGNDLTLFVAKFAP